MFEQWEYTIDEKTYEPARKKMECKISIGILTELFVYYPEGCHGLARCRIFLGMKPVAPRSPKLYLAGNDGYIPIRNLSEPIRPNIPVLNWELWNIDETYPHTLWLGASWTPMTETELRRVMEQLETLNVSFKELQRLLVGRRIS